MRLLFYFSSFVCFFYINFLFVLMYHRLLSFFFLSFFLFLFFVFCVNYRFLFPVDITTLVKWEIGLFEVSSLTIRSVFLFLYFFVWNGREQRLAFLTRHITADSADSAQFSVFWMSFFSQFTLSWSRNRLAWLETPPWRIQNQLTYLAISHSFSPTPTQQLASTNWE